MKNFEVLRQMPQACFSNMIFHVVNNDCETLEDFENFLNKEINPELESTVKEALKNLQCSSMD